MPPKKEITMEISQEQKEEINEIHKLLRKAKYFYYEYMDSEGESKSIMSDYDFDMLEKKYDKLCEEYNIPLEKRLSQYVGFDIAMPMVLFY